jgi:hypothetical protein
MTVEIKDSFKITAKRREHPNAIKYPGRPAMEFGTTAVRKFLDDLNEEQREALLDGTLVVEEEASAEFFDSILEGDVVGLGLFYGLDAKKQPAAYKFKILEIDRDRDVMKARNVTWEHPKRPEYQGEEVELAFEDFSVGLGLGFGEILERDGKPFGVSEEIEYTVNIVGDKNAEASDTTNTTDNTV